MRNDKDITFKQAWWLSLGAMTRDLRDEVLCAICSYAFDQQEPEFTNQLAQGIFVQIRADIDVEREHAEQVRESRRRSGSVGGQRSSEVRWGTSKQSKQNKQMLTSQANAYENTQNDDNSSANANNCKQNKQMLTTPPVPPTMQNNNNIYNYIISRHDDDTRTHTYAMVVGWLTDDPEAIKLLFWRAGVTKDRSEEEQLQLMAEYVDAYYEQNEFATDWQQKGRRDTKSHFASWVRVRYKKLTEDGTASKPTATGGRTRTTAGEAYDAIAVGIAIANAEDGATE